MDPLKQRLENICGGMILDVATGRGGFLGYLLETFQSHDWAIGIDISEENISKANMSFSDKKVSFVVMNADRMAFEDESFDTVAIANSLHHFSQTPSVIGEMRRVLRPGGLFVVAEMFCDGQSETQMTHVELHHWWAAVDRAVGVSHNETYTRQQIIDLTSALDLRDVDVFESSPVDGDPCDEESIDQLDNVCDEYIAKVKHDSNHDDLVSRGYALKERLRTIGFSPATELFILGRK